MAAVLANDVPVNPDVSNSGVALSTFPEPPMAVDGGAFIPEQKPASFVVAVAATADGTGIDASQKDTKASEATAASASMETSSENGTQRKTLLPPGTSMFDFVMIFVGLAFAVFLAALDQTIVSIAIPAIITDFQTTSGIAWVGVAYFLTAVPLIPTYGKLSDILGRKPVYIAAISLFELGSLICGVAPSMVVLIVGRAVAGLGGGAIFSLGLIIIADYIPIEKRGLFAGIVGAMFAIASVVGPLMGGAFTEHLTWRWCFFINLPIGAITLLTIFFFMKIPRKPHEESRLKRLAQIDWTGTVMLIIATVFLLTGLTTGGTEFAWNSAETISFLVIGGVFFVIFFYWEARHAKQGVLPIEFYKARFTLGSFLTAFLIGCTFFGLVYYIPVYLQVATGQTPTEAGVSTLPLVFGVIFGNLLCGAFASFTGRAWQFIPIGGALGATGAGLLSTLTLDSSSSMRIGYMILAGLGCGMLVQMNLLVAQGSTSQDNVALITANTAFWQNMGAVIGIAVLGVVYNNQLTPKLEAHLPPGVPVKPFITSPSLISKLPDYLKIPVQTAYIETLRVMFLIVVGTGCCVFLSSMLLRKAKLTTKKEAAGAASEPAPEMATTTETKAAEAVVATQV